MPRGMGVLCTVHILKSCTRELGLPYFLARVGRSNLGFQLRDLAQQFNSRGRRGPGRVYGRRGGGEKKSKKKSIDTKADLSRLLGDTVVYFES